MSNKIKTGQTVVTSGISEAIHENEKFDHFINACMHMFQNRVWGEMSEDDINMNDLALSCDNLESVRVMGVYKIPSQFKTIIQESGEFIWVIAYYNDNTTILFPSEY